jgi:hypothetical protein
MPCLQISKGDAFFRANRERQIARLLKALYGLAKQGNRLSLVSKVQVRKAVISQGFRGGWLVTRLDRLARSTCDLLNILALVSDNSAGFRSLSDAWADS